MHVLWARVRCQVWTRTVSQYHQYWSIFPLEYFHTPSGPDLSNNVLSIKTQPSESLVINFVIFSVLQIKFYELYKWIEDQMRRIWLFKWFNFLERKFVSINLTRCKICVCAKKRISFSITFWTLQKLCKCQKTIDNAIDFQRKPDLSKKINDTLRIIYKKGPQFQVQKTIVGGSWEESIFLELCSTLGPSLAVNGLATEEICNS